MEFTLSAFAKQAESDRYNGIPYSELDCQAFVEKVLEDLGCRNSAGKVYNWKGTNDIWRNALDEKYTYDACIEKYGTIPPGFLLFTMKHDGGEKARGYTDGYNVCHTGIALDARRARHSTTGGVQYCTHPATRWTHAGKLSCLSMLDNTDNKSNNNEVIRDTIATLTDLIKKLEAAT